MFGIDITEMAQLSLGFSSVERAPSVVELFMNGPHLSTSRYEVGNTSLNSERANNVDVSIDYQNNGYEAKLTYYANHIDNYIYLLDDLEDDDHGGLIRADYLQQDAEFKGYELSLRKVFKLGNGNLTLSASRDAVRAKFTDGSDVPRIIPTRNIYSVLYTSDRDLRVKLSLKDVEKQKNIGVAETATDGYEMLDFNLAKKFRLNSRNEVTLSVFANNLLDKVARNHTSFVKEAVPLAGRNFGIKLRFRM